MDLYGPSLSQLRHKIEGSHFSMRTTIRVAKETITILESLHENGVVHCDIKPSNFLLNKASIGGFVLIDYGLSSLWKDPKTDEHIPQKKSNGFRGTLKYTSVNVHKLIEPSRRDDVISWFYSIVELAKGELPWKNVKDNNLSMSCKQTITPEKLCSGLPRQFIEMWNSIKNLKFTDSPNYEFLKEQLNEALVENTDDNNQYEWEVDTQILHQLTPHPELFDSKLVNLSAQPIQNGKQHKKCRIC
ncbi:CK1 family protein kinase [Histomonas meleagridis]|uniref:CK1 family protein kinase n=1 Tax=Histomonas meleagridis TaxID=135588 RepID=UPI00355A7FC1|nr:CK1 family protein kinase [Histomonas meleagridis]KAH0801300.1 CK1 family protein kinase [Histomonas meleagridis]